jgi:hypothetical protein
MKYRLKLLNKIIHLQSALVNKNFKIFVKNLAFHKIK